MKVLISGGAGFMGSHLAKQLIGVGHDVTVLDDLSGGFEENVPEGARFIKGSINHVGLVNDMFRRGRFDYVYHLAAYAAEGLSHFIKNFNYTNNLMGSINLINASINNGVKCFVFASSIAVYGTSPQLPMTEETPTKPEDSYGIAKLAVEQELHICKRMFGMDYIIFRAHNIFGNRQNIGDKYRNVVGIFMNQIMQGRPMTIFGDGNQTRAFSYVGDVIPILVEAIHTPMAYNRVFNIGADVPCTVKELALSVAKAMGVEANIQYLPARQEVQHAYASHDKLRGVFGIRDTHSLEDGLARMAEWVKQHGARKGQSFGGVEITKNFPEAWAEYV